MAGNILTCQNFSADAVDMRGERHCLGSIFDLPAGSDAPMPELVRWKERREQCKDCVVRFICRGGCPYTEEKYREYNCLAGYYQSLPVFALALHIITGDLLVEITPSHPGEHHA
jgi:radical SAM protein with 4Fe4S-binding SPASM domain